LAKALQVRFLPPAFRAGVVKMEDTKEKSNDRSFDLRETVGLPGLLI
jgi:hypothetical protein